MACNNNIELYYMMKKVKLLYLVSHYIIAALCVYWKYKLNGKYPW